MATPEEDKNADNTQGGRSEGGIYSDASTSGDRPQSERGLGGMKVNVACVLAGGRAPAKDRCA